MRCGKLSSPSREDSIPPFDVILLGYCPGGSKPRRGPKDQSSIPTLTFGLGSALSGGFWRILRSVLPVSNLLFEFTKIMYSIFGVGSSKAEAVVQPTRQSPERECMER